MKRLALVQNFLCPALPKAKTSEPEVRKCLLIEKMLLEVGVGGLKASTSPSLENPEFRLLLCQGKGEQAGARGGRGPQTSRRQQGSRDEHGI